MRSFATICLAVLGALPVAAGFQLARPAEAHVPNPCDGLKEVPLFVEGVPADAFVARLRAPENREQAIAYVRNFIQAEPPEGLGIKMEIGELVDRLEQLDKAPQGIDKEAIPEQLWGFAGLSTVLLLQKLLPLDGPPIADKVLYGKIRDYTYVDATKSGHLSVDVCIDRKEFVPLGQDRRVFYHWDVEIPAGLFSVHERVPPSDVSDAATYDNPFPDLDLSLPPEAFDPANPRSLWRRGLDHKLNATGTEIVVRNVFFRRLSDPNLVRVDSNDPIYTSTPASCVDLFTVGQPPATFAELVGNAYCLGRCAHPAIFNTGD